MSDFVWTDARVNRLRALAAAGKSATEIGEAFGISRNAVLGKGSRLGICFGGQHTPLAKKKAKYRTVPKSNSVRPLIELRAVRPETVVPLMELSARQCRYPFGDPHADDFGFCGGEVLPGSAFCACHHSLVWVSAKGEVSCPAGI